MGGGVPTTPPGVHRKSLYWGASDKSLRSRGGDTGWSGPRRPLGGLSTGGTRHSFAYTGVTPGSRDSLGSRSGTRDVFGSPRRSICVCRHGHTVHSGRLRVRSLGS